MAPMTSHLRRIAGLLLLMALAAPAARAVGTPATAVPAAHEVLPWIADDYTRAVALAKARQVPIFVESWAPW